MSTLRRSAPRFSAFALLLALCVLCSGGPALAQLLPAVHPWSLAVDHSMEDHAFHDETTDPDARGVDLTGARLDRANFQSGQLDGATLVYLSALSADFSGASFTGVSALFADFSRASFTGADLREADFTGAIFDSADLSDAILVGLSVACGDDPSTVPTDLVCANFDFATLDGVDASCELDVDGNCIPAQRADFRGASLQWVSAVGARFDDAAMNGSASTPTRLDGGDFSDASFVRTDFSREGPLDPVDPDKPFVSLSGARVVGADFSEAKLAYADLRSLYAAKLAAADSPADFTKTDLSNADLRLADLAGATITETNFRDADLSGAFLDDAVDPCNADGSVCVDFTGALLSGAVLDGVDLSGLSFAGHAGLDGTSFVDATLTGTDFSSANLRDAIFLRMVVDAECVANVECPDFTGASMDGATLIGIDFEAIGFVFRDLAGPSLVGADLGSSILRSKTTDPGYVPDLGSMDLEGARFSSVTAYDTGFASANLRSADFTDASLECADFTNADLREADFARAALCDTEVCPAEDPVTGSRCAYFSGALVAADAMFGGADFSEVSFPTSQPLASMGLTDLGGATLDQASFDGVDLSGVGFVDASLRDASLVSAIGVAMADWTDADLSGAVLHGVDFSGVDLRDTILDAVSLCDTSGVDVAQCALLAGAMLAGTDTDLDLGVRMRDVDFSVLADLADATVPYDSDLTGADLSYTDLRRSDFRSLDLNGTRFIGALLFNADFRLAGLDGADFSDAQLDNATLTGALLPTGCTTIFDGASLSGVVWHDARFDLADCFDFLAVDPDLRFVDFSDATISTETETTRLAGIDLSRSNLPGVIMTHADARGTDFDSMSARCLATDSFCATFSSSDFSDAILRAADLRSVILSDATLVRSNLAQARLDGANLDGADLTDASLDSAKLVGASLIATTLTRVSLDAANLSRAKVHDVDFTGLDLRTATLDAVSLCGTAADGVTIERCATLLGATLPGSATALGVRMRDVDFRVLADPSDLVAPFSWQLSGSDLSYTDLQGALFGELDLRGNALVGALLGGADLSAANIDGADLSAAQLDGAILTDVLLPAGCNTMFDGALLSGAVWQRANFVVADCFDFSSVDPDLRLVDFSDAVISSTAAPAALAGVDLSGSDLQGADLTSADLTGALLDGVDLSGVDLTNALLATTDLSNSTVHDVDFTGVDLRGAILDTVSLCDTGNDGATISQCATLAGAVLAGSDTLPGVRMRGVDFRVLADPTDVSPPSSWQLTGSDLSYTDLQGAQLGGLDLRGNTLVGALLDSVDFSAAGLDGTDLTDASLDGADLTNASLRGASLVFARFADAEFSAGAQNSVVVAGEPELACTPAGGTSAVDLLGANLAAADFSSAKHFYPGCIAFDQTTRYSKATQFPPGFPDPPNMTLIPEPTRALMQVAVLGTLWLLRRRRAERGRSTLRPLSALR